MTVICAFSSCNNLSNSTDQNTDTDNTIIDNDTSTEEDTDTNIDTEKIFTKNYSTKENPSGFGLYEVNKFLRRNPQSYLTTTIDKNNKLFTQTLTIDSKLQLIKEDNSKESTVA